VVRSVEPNPACRDISPAEGKICVKAFGLVQKMYNPDRIRGPLIRTNPPKGRDEDPQWREITWDEAITILAERMKQVRQGGLLDSEGYPKLAVIMGQAASPAAYAGTLPAFFSAWGPIDFTIGGGEGIKCYHSEHLFCEYWHRCFIGAGDTPRSELVISLGHNTNASGGAAGVLRHATARRRGYKRIQVEPHLSVSATTSDEWIPIKVKTDSAFLYALIHVLLHEHDRARSLDVPFLQKRTASPYLVGPNGFYLRDGQSREPLVWDASAGAAKPFNALGIGEFALEGEYQAAGIEIGADGQEWRHDQGVACKTGFQAMLEFMKPYTPEWAAAICDVPAATIRRARRQKTPAAAVSGVLVTGCALPSCTGCCPGRPAKERACRRGPGSPRPCHRRRRRPPERKIVAGRGRRNPRPLSPRPAGPHRPHIRS